jgi:hypothetical protein
MMKLTTEQRRLAFICVVIVAAGAAALFVARCTGDDDAPTTMPAEVMGEGQEGSSE